MKKQKKNFRSRLILSWMTVLFFAFQAQGALADAPQQALKGALPIPNTSETREFLYDYDKGTVLNNDGTQLIWEDGNLTLYFYGMQVLWTSDTEGKGKRLAFQRSDGRLVIKDGNDNIIWSNQADGGEKLEVLDNRNLVVKNGSNQTIWKTETAIPQLKENELILIGADVEEVTYNIKSWDLELIQTGAQDFRIPDPATYKYLYLEAEGADGGKRVVKETWGTTRFTVNAGSGATIKATFEIGTAANQIPPGSILRFIVGKSGADVITQRSEGGSGGGGTGVLVKKPGNLNWYLLMVAGGGGGAFSDCCTNKKVGTSAEIYLDGHGGGKGGSQGHGADPGGGGAFGKVDYYDKINGIVPAWPYGDTDKTSLPMGYTDQYDTHAGAGDGGFGFGAGENGTAFWSGGGGGYSGGGEGGGSGGSYLTADFAVHDVVRIKNPSTSDTEHGFVRYKFSNSLLDVSKTIRLASAATPKCVTNAGDKLESGNNIQLFDCKTGVLSQNWLFDGYQIKVANYTGYCMDVRGHETSNGTNVRIWGCMEHNEQRWIYDGLTKQFRSLLDLDKCLNVAYGGRTDNGTNIQLWNCLPDGGKGNQWIVNDAYSISDPTASYYLVPVKASGLALQSALGAKWGSNVQLGTKGADASEKWVFEDGQIKFAASPDLCIALKDGSTSNETNIELRGCSDNDAKKWVYDGMTKQIRSAVNPDKCMAVATSGGVFEKGMNIQIMDCNQHSRQKFDIK